MRGSYYNEIDPFAAEMLRNLIKAGHIAPGDVGEAATLKLGDVNARLAPIQVSADGLRDLGIEPAGRDKRAVLYRESQFAAICEAIARRAMEAKRAALLQD